MYRLRFPRRLTLAGLVLLGGLVMTARSDNPPDDQKIAELEKQINDLQKRLVDLKGGAKPSGKKPLTLAEAETWRSVRGVALSPDGKWFAHRVGPAEGDGDVILRSVADGKETKYPGGGGFGQLSFSHDSKWFAFTASPFRRPGATPVGPPAPPAKPKAVLVNLGSGEKSEFEGMSSIQFSGEAATHVAFRKATESVGAGPTAQPPGIPNIPGLTPPASGASAPTGSDLVLRELASGSELVLGNVKDYSFDKKGTWLVMLIDAAGQIGNGVHLRDMKSGAVFPIETGKATYSSLSWNEDFTALAVMKAVEDKEYEGKWNTVLGFTDLGPKPTKTAYDPKGDKEFPKDMGISSNRGASWTDGLDAIVIGIAEQKKKDATKKETAPAPKDSAKADDAKTEQPGRRRSGSSIGGAAASAPGKPDLILWHWKDERLQPMQEKQAVMDKMFAYTAAYRVKEKKLLRLADDAVKSVSVAPKAKFAIGRDTKPYEYMSNLDGRRYSDIYVTDMKTGERKKALTKARFVMSPSPTGTHFLYYQDGHYFVYDMSAGKGNNITEAISATSFVDVEDDHNIEKPPTRAVGWSRDGQFVLLSDGWDIWKVSTDGSGGANLTLDGKRDGIRYQAFGVRQFEADPKPGIDLSKPIYLAMTGEWTKKDGLGRIDPDKAGVTRLLWADCQYGTLVKARDAEVFAVSRGTNQEYPDYYLAAGDFKDPKKVTDANPQQKDYQWSAGARLVEYKGVNGKRLQGALFLPGNYEPGKKYPTVVYIYEKLSNGLHQYSAPSNFGFNKAMYTSNGYAVLMPDITYRINDPGKSAVECILPALDAAIATGVVDGDKIGLQGHSWGGYQTAFLVTQTNRFKAAVAGAPLTDLVSMYSSVYWNTGSANQPIFESSQGRFTAGYWDQQEAYIRNSPVYFAKNVATPLVILHNDKDGAVDFTQGVEYYNTLRRLQKPVVMLQYKGENHGLEKKENRKDYAVRMREFFDHYLQGKPAPNWWKEGVPHLKMDEHLKDRK